MSPWPQSPKYQNFIVSFPDERILQITLNRPQKLNSIDKATSREIQAVWEAFDQDESLWVGIITGNGRAFCTGADLQEWNRMNQTREVNSMDAPGLAGLPRRSGKKPIIAAVNGICMGGGFEMIANCDLVLASASATFALPEVKRGIVPVAGCLPRLTRTIGLQRTMDLVLTGRNVNAKTLHDWGLVSQVVDAGADVASAAVKIAQQMCQNSPDSLIVGREGVRLSWESGSVEEAVSTLADQWYPRLMGGVNFAEGIQAFVEKRPPNWVNSKL
ncbi:enoyl-CoA hydratase/isomerase family protein [Penicillium argentinense]|uniref:Enoyl-CoA hydratase/isomerase family protein n=1 Tax=Penicillium argentinense TaxID=1131581 RepID=A0A9W9G2U0_9EURO|nr:enoyl-CoA hydratase/isomerase family protein [Penicillium argentinense]KAJ5111023.1 enoyl-CoA hydratase/isomerase family protein [Penicillium argentinense]